jgi:hypothetical protein
MKMRHIVIRGLLGSTTFFTHYLIKAQFSKNKIIEHKNYLF